MKKTTLAEAATQVVLGLPQEELHEGLDRNMKNVLSFLDNYVKSNEVLTDDSEVDEMIELCEEQIQDNLEDAQPSAIAGLKHAQWYILYEALDQLYADGDKNHKRVVSVVKTMLSAFKAVEKIKV